MSGPIGDIPDHPDTFLEYCGKCSGWHKVECKGETWTNYAPVGSLCIPEVWDEDDRSWRPLTDEDKLDMVAEDFEFWTNQMFSELLLRDAILDDLARLDSLDCETF